MDSDEDVGYYLVETLRPVRGTLIPDSGSMDPSRSTLEKCLDLLPCDLYL